MALGFAAMNTGNNLLYLLLSMLLALIVVSGILSEQCIRGLTLAPVAPDEIFARSPALLAARVHNGKRWAPSYSITLEVMESGGRVIYVPKLEAGAERTVTWEVTFTARGRQRVPGIRVATRFPFGLFRKAGLPARAEEVVVYPALVPMPEVRGQASAGTSIAALPRRGRGDDVYNLRDYRPEDDRRLIHWRSSAKTAALIVREMAEEAAADACIVLVGAGRDRERLERALSEAASLAVHLLRGGAGVELRAPGLVVPLGRGRAHERSVLTALALYQPGAATVSAAGRRLREIVVDLG
ncbi:MAG TPA: DUF58 domain-containing protein [Methylomirabilota bacterium]